MVMTNMPGWSRKKAGWCQKKKTKYSNENLDLPESNRGRCRWWCRLGQVRPHQQHRGDSPTPFPNRLASSQSGQSMAAPRLEWSRDGRPDWRPEGWLHGELQAAHPPGTRRCWTWWGGRHAKATSLPTESPAVCGLRREMAESPHGFCYHHQLLVQVHPFCPPLLCFTNFVCPSCSSFRTSIPWNSNQVGLRSSSSDWSLLARSNRTCVQIVAVIICNDTRITEFLWSK